MNYWKIDKEDVCNGEGLRVVLWLSGCSHRCRGCQNPRTWDADSGIPFDEPAKEELFRELDKDIISGLTLSGGDPLHENNLDGVLDLVTEVNKRYNTAQYTNEIRLSRQQKSIWLYTGYKAAGIRDGLWVLEPDTATEKRSDILSKCDVLIDGRYMDSQRDITLPWRGSSNQRVISIQKSLQKGKIVLWKD